MHVNTSLKLYAKGLKQTQTNLTKKHVVIVGLLKLCMVCQTSAVLKHAFIVVCRDKLQLELISVLDFTPVILQRRPICCTSVVYRL